MSDGKSSSSALLSVIGERLRTQDNHCTQNPMYCVQERRREYGYDLAYAEHAVWIDMASGDYEETEPGAEGAEEIGYKDRWETVMVAFTEEGCKEYLRLNGHNHGETRIYVESWNRCPEMIAIREHLMGG